MFLCTPVCVAHVLPACEVYPLVGPPCFFLGGSCFPVRFRVYTLILCNESLFAKTLQDLCVMSSENMGCGTDVESQVRSCLECGRVFATGLGRVFCARATLMCGGNLFFTSLPHAAGGEKRRDRRPPNRSVLDGHARGFSVGAGLPRHGETRLYVFLVSPSPRGGGRSRRRKNHASFCF